MKQRLLSLIVCVAVLSTVSLAFAEDVYATKNGKKFHKEDCRLIKSKNPESISRKEAVTKGLEPCAKCFKDELSSVTESADKKLSMSKKSKKQAE